MIRDLFITDELEDVVLHLVHVIIDQKKLKFSANEYTFDPLLIDHQILRKEKDYEIIRFDIVAVYVIEHFKKNMGFKFSGVFSENIIILEKINQHFTSENPIRNYHKLRDEFWLFILRETLTVSKFDIFSFINTYSIEDIDDQVYQFGIAFSKEFCRSNIVIDTACKVVHKLILLLQDENVNYNLPLNQLFKSVRNKCEDDFDYGYQFLQFFLDDPKTFAGLISAIVSGLYVHKNNQFNEVFLNEYLNKEPFLNPIIYGLSKASKLDEYDYDKFIEIVNIFETYENSRRQLIALLLTLLKSQLQTYKEIAIDRINNLLDTADTVAFVLTYINHEEEFSEYLIDWIQKLISKEDFSINSYSRVIETCFLEIKDFDGFKKTVLSLIEYCPFQSISEIFRHFLYSTEAAVNDKFLVELLIDDNAAKRFTGHDFIEKKSSPTKAYKFSFDILSLKSIDQYKLWVSLCTSSKEPKFYIPALLPLLESKSDLVKEAFTSKLEVISEDYGREVILLLENSSVEGEEGAVTEVIVRIKDFLAKFREENILLKKGLKELDPNYTDLKGLKTYNSSYYKTMSRNIGKDAERSSLLGVLGIGKIQLAKGGGWRIGNQLKVSKLSSFESSFSLPRSYFINPDEFDLIENIERRQDWTEEDFRLIEEYLSNE